MFRRISGGGHYREIPKLMSPIADGMQWASRITSVCGIFVLPLLIGIWIDGVFGISPACVLIGSLFGFVGGMWSTLTMCKIPKTYKITFKNGVPQSITCLKCQMTSHNPNDIEQKYCGRCHIFHEDKQGTRE